MLNLLRREEPIMDTYKVAVLEDEKKIVIHEAQIKKPEKKQVLIRVASCAICTLEQRVYSGVMKKYPFAGGHEAAGIVEAVGEGVKQIKKGDKVAVRLLNSCGECYYCRNGHENQCVVSFIAATQEIAMGPGGLAEYMMIDAENVYKMADELPLSYAALAEPLACCVHSIENGKINLADDVVIVGAGIMGIFHVQLAKLRGARVIVAEVDDNRLEVAKKMGADVIINSSQEDPVERIKQLTDGRGADVVFCTAAIPEVASQSVDMAGKLGRVVFYSSFHPNNPIEINPNKIHSAETIITGSVNPQRKDFLVATKLLSNGLIDVSELISETYTLDNIEEAFHKAIDPYTYRIIVNCNI